MAWLFFQRTEEQKEGSNWNLYRREQHVQYIQLSVYSIETEIMIMEQTQADSVKTVWLKITIKLKSKSAQTNSALQGQHDVTGIDLWYYFRHDLKFQHSLCISRSTQTSKNTECTALQFVHATVACRHWAHVDTIGQPSYCINSWTADTYETIMLVDVGQLMSSVSRETAGRNKEGH